LLNKLAEEIHEISLSKGFWDKLYNKKFLGKNKPKPKQDIDFMLAKLALVHSEISEVLEAMRKQQGEEKIVEEIADVLIRLLDFYQGAKLSGWVESSLDDIYSKKMAKNKSRPPMHGNLA
jgi:hypothetical protein